MSEMLKSSGAMAVATLTSRVLGLVREMVYAAFMGPTWVASAFFLAFQVPNLFRRLLGEGALTAAFIPIFKQKEVKEGEAEMWRTANAVLSGLVIAAAVVTALAVLAISLALAFHTFIFFSSRRRHTRFHGDWSSDMCSSDLHPQRQRRRQRRLSRQRFLESFAAPHQFPYRRLDHLRHGHRHAALEADGGLRQLHLRLAR